jgi:hypothetical protein
MQIFASLPNILVSPLDTPLVVLAARSVSELCLETYVNIFGRERLLAEKPNDDSLAVLHLLNEKP